MGIQNKIFFERLHKAWDLASFAGKLPWGLVQPRNKYLLNECVKVVQPCGKFTSSFAP